MGITSSKSLAWKWIIIWPHKCFLNCKSQCQPRVAVLLVRSCGDISEWNCLDREKKNVQKCKKKRKRGENAVILVNWTTLAIPRKLPELLTEVPFLVVTPDKGEGRIGTIPFLSLVGSSDQVITCERSPFSLCAKAGVCVLLSPIKTMCITSALVEVGLRNSMDIPSNLPWHKQRAWKC